MDWAFEYTEKKPLTTEEDYPYVSQDYSRHDCQPQEANGTVGATTFHDVEPQNITQAKAALNIGPLAGAVAGYKMEFQSYKGGVITTDTCGHSVDQGVVVVGYGS